MLKRLLLAALVALATVALSYGQTTPTPPGYAVLGGQTTLAVTNSSANAALPASVVPYGAVTIYNKGANDAYVALGVDNTAAATTASTLVVAGTSITIYAGSASTYLAAITASSTTTLVVYQGTGPVALSGGAAGAGAGGATTVADGANVVEGATTDAAAAAGGTGTISAKLRRLSTQLPAAVGQTTMSASLPVTLASNQSTITTQPAGWTASNITTATTTVVKSGAGVLHLVNVNTKGTVASTVTVYDNTAASGTKLATIDSLNLSGPFQYDVSFVTGLTVVTTGTAAPDITVSYR